jgi:hypothetical protein
MTETQVVKAQGLFLRQVQSKLPPGISAVAALMEDLGIGKSEAYKKLRGETVLSLEQIQLLCNRYAINFTVQGYANRQSAFVDFTPFCSTALGVNDYIKNLQMFLRQIASASPTKLTCATDDIPIFHLFQYPELTAFKLHFWQLRVADNAPLKLAMDNWPAHVLQQAAQLYHLYKTIPSVEIWTKTSLLNTLEQIQYSADSGIISDHGLGRAICQQLRQALADIEGYAKSRDKGINEPVLFDWYFYDIIGSITYLAEMNGNLATYIRFNTFNTLHEYDGPLCAEVQHWLNNMLKDATGFSGQGSIQRSHYLENAYKSCLAMEQRFR